MAPLPTGVTTGAPPARGGATPTAATPAGGSTPTATTPTASPGDDRRFLKRVRVGSYDIWFFDLTGKYGSGGWAWWDNTAWLRLGERMPQGFGPDHARELGIATWPPGSTGTTTVVAVPPGAVTGPGGAGIPGAGGGVLGQGDAGPGAPAPGGGGTGGTGTTSTVAQPPPAGGGSPVPTVGGRTYGPWYDTIGYAPVVLGPPDPAWDEAVRRGRPQDYVRIREELAGRYPSGGPLRPGDPWYRVVRIGDRDVELYDLGGKTGSGAGWVWWKPGVGWVDLAATQPPGFSPELADAYTRQQRQRGHVPAGSGTGTGTGTGATGTQVSGGGGPLGTGTGTGPGTAVGTLLGSGFAESHGGITRSIDPFSGRAATYPIPAAGQGTGEAVTQSSGGGGVVLRDGTRVVFDGEDRYAGGRGVRWDRAVYDPRAQRWTYFGLRGRTADGREWQADEAWYEAGAGGLVARFRTGGKDGVRYLPGKA